MTQFIETQFPIARLSAESFRERKAVSGQTLTGLGKWWGRKPLILVRASIIGMLMPASNDPKKDRDIFLKILTMDDDGTWNRCEPSVQRKVSRTDFDKLSYADRISYCSRPENVLGPSAEAWREINTHLGTRAESLVALVEQLGAAKFGHTPRVGDCFCGGGSIPFEAARIGCESLGSDLNPVAGLLTWGSVNLICASKTLQKELNSLQQEVLKVVDQEVTSWRIEHNEEGERADAYLYCVEVKPEGCEYYIPLAPSWVVAEKPKVVVTWKRFPNSDRLLPIVQTVSETELKQFKNKRGATSLDGRVVDPFDSNRSWSVEALRGPEGLRRWSNDDVIPRPGDVFQERLYCIRWVNANGERRYAAPSTADLEREARVLELLNERFKDWQQKGFIPSKAIPDGGDKTEEPIRTRGWTHWHHLFTPRQLLVHGLIAHSFARLAKSTHHSAAGLLTIGRLANWNSRICQWLQTQGGGIGGGKATFANQALNTLFNFSVRPLISLRSTIPDFGFFSEKNFRASVKTNDARDLDEYCDLWITDPPYADAVNYHELADFFLAWYEKQLAKTFPEWIPDSRAQLAVRGDGEDFRRSMVEIYRNLAKHMPDNGLQMVMFTHQNPAVWADLGMILWAAGLKATAAWTISTETEASGIKKGNYVQGTVCLVLRKRIGSEAGFLDEIYPLVEDEVRSQVDSMRALDEDGEPNFNDADYQLAAYAAALKVLTQYGVIDGKDVEHEVFAVRQAKEKSAFQEVIERALVIACDYLVPQGLQNVWRELSIAERYYMRALDIESRGERRQGMYEELARGFGITDVKPLLQSDKANGARMHTASSFASALLAADASAGHINAAALPSRRGRTAERKSHPFAGTPLRHLLFAIKETAAAANNPEPGRQYLRDTFGQGYWSKREHLVGLLEWISRLESIAGMNEWHEDSDAARILLGRLRNDHA